MEFGPHSDTSPATAEERGRLNSAQAEYEDYDTFSNDFTHFYK